jgi:hypothetical protein
MLRTILGFALIVLAMNAAAQGYEPPSGDDQADATDVRNPDDLRDEDTCDDKGGPPSMIKYGAAYIEVKPSHNVHRTFQWRIKLIPKTGYAGATVIIKGKDASGAWINKIAKASVDDEFYICVPPDIALGDYYYSVEVIGVGTIDPRARVVQ